MAQIILQQDMCYGLVENLKDQAVFIETEDEKESKYSAGKFQMEQFLFFEDQVFADINEKGKTGQESQPGEKYRLQ